jgi:hypothetical protein
VKQIMYLRARSIFGIIVCGVMAALLVAATASAADWPTRSVKFIVTLGPGSGTDIGARLLADRLTQRWGQPVIVENRPGAVVVVHGASVPARQPALQAGRPGADHAGVQHHPHGFGTGRHEGQLPR